MRVGLEGRPACFLERVSATIYGVKPAEILSIGEREFRVVCECYFNKETRAVIRTVRINGRKRQVIVYHKKCLERVMSREEVRALLIRFGYCVDCSSEEYVEQLIERLRENDFPHEIGIFLGYPLNDVCGYLGLNSLEHTKTKGWKMYGDTRESERLQELFIKVRGYAKNRFDKFFSPEHDEAMGVLT